MKRTYERGWLLLLLGAVIAAGGALNAVAQAPPSRPAKVGDLQLVASLMSDQPAGLAITDSGRLLVTFPRHDGPVAFTVGEVKGGQVVPYPNAELNHPTKARPADALFSVQTLLVDASHRLWMLDTGTLQFGEPPVKGAAKLIAVDLGTDRVVRTVVLPSEALVPQSALKDFRFDFHRGQGGTIFITDSAPGFEALIVLDLTSGHAIRRLTGIPAVSAQPGHTPIVGFEPLLKRPGKADEQGPAKPWLVGLNALELSADGKTLYFSAFTGRRLYSVSADDLSNPAFDDGKLASEVAAVGDVGMGGHFALGASGDLFFLNIEQNAIFRRAVDGRTQAVVVDPRLMWPDTLAIGTDKYLYVTTSQHDRRPEFHGGAELRRRPYGLFRVFVGSGPATARWR
ncbi:MAG: gluconolaconase [Acidobacteriia bacterium]|nr:gluconolaconase [Terriglobia bacterium]